MYHLRLFGCLSLVWLYTLCVCVACNNEPIPTSSEGGRGGTALEVVPVALVPGESLGGARVGMTYAELKAAIGEPDSQIGFRRTQNLSYIAPRLEVVLTSVEDDVLDDQSLVIAIGTLPGAIVEGELSLGAPLESLTARLGEPSITSGDVRYYTPLGLAVEVIEGVVERLAVWSPFVSEPEPPPMLEAQGEEGGDPVISPSGGEAPRFEFEGERYEVVDAHLHTGRIEAQVPSGVAFLVSQIPSVAQLYFPATTPQVLSPYDPFQGIQEHTRTAGVAHAVLLATYTQHTIGYASNSELEEKLLDPKNVSPNGGLWAWGMASVNYEGFEDEAIAQERLAALESYFVVHPERFIGVKLAHAHQAVRFDDPVYLGVYDVAARQGVPVLLHTGFSPFPNTQTEPEYYDPASLEAVVEAYDGAHGAGRVDFVLSHIGQGDARAIEHSLSLAERYENVWLELSAINRPLLINEVGEPVDDPTLMHTYVISEIKARGLAGKLIFATDGPQYFGKVHSYLRLMAETMRDAGFTKGELRGALAENFYRCFSRAASSR